MMTKRICLLFGSLLLFLNIYGQKVQSAINLKEYYFPYKTCFTPVDYRFINNADATESIKWTLQTTLLNKDTLLNIKVYDTINRLVEETTHKIVEEGVVLQRFIVYKYKGDSCEQQHCSVTDSLVYSFHQQTNAEILWKVCIMDAPPVFMKRSREFIGQDKFTTGMKFNDKYYFTINGEDYLDHQVKSTYSKNKGLTTYSIMNRKGISKVFKLE